MAVLPVAVPSGVLLASVLALSPSPSTLEARPGSAPASAASPLKAAVVYNSARFVTWPADVFPARDSALVVCVLGSDPFGPELDAFLSGKTVDDRPLRVRRGGHESELEGCHVLYVGASEASRLDRVFAAFGRGVLTLSDIPRFAERGGMIGLVVERGRVGFEINTLAAQDADLDVSSKLLKLAKIIR